MATKTNTFNVIFHLRKIAATYGKLPVYACITIDSKRIELAVKQLINPINWNESRGMAKGNKEELKILNKYLEQLRASYVDCYREMTLSKKVITVEDFQVGILWKR
ncbi:MAG: Arm DNA-binding domain-containing protein [Segetibacter sp.]